MSRTTWDWESQATRPVTGEVFHHQVFRRYIRNISSPACQRSLSFVQNTGSIFRAAQNCNKDSADGPVTSERGRNKAAPLTSEESLLITHADHKAAGETKTYSTAGSSAGVDTSCLQVWGSTIRLSFAVKQNRESEASREPIWTCTVIFFLNYYSVIYIYLKSHLFPWFSATFSIDIVCIVKMIEYTILF